MRVCSVGKSRGGRVNLSVKLGAKKRWPPGRCLRPRSPGGVGFRSIAKARDQCYGQLIARLSTIFLHARISSPSRFTSQFPLTSTLLPHVRVITTPFGTPLVRTKGNLIPLSVTFDIITALESSSRSDAVDHGRESPANASSLLSQSDERNWLT